MLLFTKSFRDLVSHGDYSAEFPRPVEYAAVGPAYKNCTTVFCYIFIFVVCERTRVPGDLGNQPAQILSTIIPGGYYGSDKVSAQHLGFFIPEKFLRKKN